MVVDKHDNAELDYEQKIQEMRFEWEANEALKYGEKHATDDDDFDDELYPSDISSYLERTSQRPIIASNEKANGSQT